MPIEKNPYEHLSITIACHTSERGKLLKDLLPSLPRGSQIVVVFNEQGEEGDCKVAKDEVLADGTHLVFAEWRWKDFSFADARNHALDLAAREWVLWLDADELLNAGQYHVLQNLPNVPPGVGGLMVTVAGMQPSLYKGDDPKHYAVPQPRIVRNDPSFRFEGRCHEQIAWTIYRQGYSIEQTPMVVTHTGYVADKATMIDKMERNVSLLIAQCNEWDSEDLFFTKLLHRDLSNLLSLKAN